MTSGLPSSFASAAAGQNRDSRTGGRSDGTRGNGSGEWTRREGRSTNGTLTFRRSSTTPFNQPVAQTQSDTPPPLPADSTSALASARSAFGFDPLPSTQYSREELLEISRSIPASLQDDVANLFIPGWNPAHVNGNSARPWGKSSEAAAVPQDPGVCWDDYGLINPIGLQDMSAEEKDLFATDVNSPLKLPPQTKDAGQAAGGPNGRKASVSLASTSAYGMSSPSTASRPGTRRRETADTNPFPAGGLASPTATASRFSRDDPSPWFGRKPTESKETPFDEPEEELRTPAASEPGKSGSFGGLLRGTAPGASSFGQAASLWGSAAAAPSTAAVGSFGNFAFSSSAVGDKRPAATRGESRLAHLIPKESSETAAARDGSSQDALRAWRSRPRTDTDPFGDDESASGSAVLGGSRDVGAAQPNQRSGAYDTPVKATAGDFGMSGLTLGSHAEHNDPGSPSETNPYRSPLAERGDEDHGEPGGPPEQPSNFSTLSRNFGTGAFDGSDRSQTSSVGAKGYASINNLTGWPSTGTPDRERAGFSNAFGPSLFNPMGDLHSPGLGGLGGVFGPPAAGPIGGGGSLRGSRLHSLLPQAMEGQRHGPEPDSLGDSVPASDMRLPAKLGAIGRGPIGQPRDTESPMRTGRGAFEDVFGGADPSRPPFTSAEQAHASLAAVSQPPAGFASAAPGSSFPAGPSASDPPPSQSRTMVMPDRMRWEYLDPQGLVQGPFTGLEMNDWYKANFFTADLRVKKLEDPEFEPLGQLIRRIGNSREPFLVPQIGIPHGDPSQPGPFSPGDTRGVVPPLVGAFPTFGRTLTAEEQNNLERRKQEEQFLMARQREFLAQQQALNKLQMQGVGGVPGSLQHHSSAHSLQSQPSFGSITSPIGMPPQPPIGAMGPGPTFFAPPAGVPQGSQAGIGPPSELFRPDLNNHERQVLANLHGIGGNAGGFAQQPIGAAPTDQSLKGQLPSTDQLTRDEQGFSDRLKQFEQLRAQHEAEEASKAAARQTTADALPEDAVSAVPSNLPGEGIMDIIKEATQEVMTQRDDGKSISQSAQQLSLTQQVQNAQAASAAIATPPQPSQAEEDPWSKQGASGLPMPFPPPQSTTPLPAPMAVRGRSKLPEQYADHDRSESGSPESSAAAAVPAQAPPLAPWAREPGIEAQKGPSLKEIQEAEAKKAAKAEEVAAAARRAAMEQEAALIREREKTSAAAASGLPSTSTWGTGSPVGAPATGSPWAKPTVTRTVSSAIPAGNTANDRKKTLAEIQREEEVRKNRASEMARQTVGPAPVTGLGKRYADLASKVSAQPPALASQSPPAAASQPPTAGGWATVGAGGKVKIPTGPAAQTRAVSVASTKPAAVPVVARPMVKSSDSGIKDSGNAAREEFVKWLNRELSKGLNGITDISAFSANMLDFPLDVDLISETVYQYSTTMDTRHFAEEFVRRKKLADKGVVEKQPAPSVSTDGKSGNGGGWSEVAKKGSNSTQKDEANIPGAGFKVVPGRKKGKK